MIVLKSECGCMYWLPDNNKGMPSGVVVAIPGCGGSDFKEPFVLGREASLIFLRATVDGAWLPGTVDGKRAGELWRGLEFTPLDEEAGETEEFSQTELEVIADAGD